MPSHRAWQTAVKLGRSVVHAGSDILISQNCIIAFIALEKCLSNRHSLQPLPTYNATFTRVLCRGNLTVDTNTATA